MTRFETGNLPISAQTQRRIESLFAAARERLEARDHEAAVERLQAVLELDASTDKARELLISIRETLESQPLAQYIEKMLNRAEAHLASGDLAHVHAVASRVFDLAPDNQAALRLLELSSERSDTLPVSSAEIEPFTEPRESPQARLIARIDQLLVLPPEPSPAASSAAAIAALIDARDLHGARQALDDASEAYPEAPELAEVRERLDITLKQIREWVEQARGLMQAGDYGAAAERLDEIDARAANHLETEALREALEASLRAQEQAAERSRAIASAGNRAGRLLANGRLEEASRELAAAEKRWGELVELAELKTRIEQAEKDRLEASQRAIETEKEIRVGDSQPRPERLDRPETLAPSVDVDHDLSTGTQRALEPRLEDNPGSLRSVVVSLAILAVLAVAITWVVRLEQPDQEGRRTDARPAEAAVVPKPKDRYDAVDSARQSGHLEIVVSAPSRVRLEGLERGGRKNAVIHRFSGVDAGVHTVTVWRSGHSVRVVRKARVKPAETTRLEIDVPWQGDGR